MKNIIAMFLGAILGCLFFFMGLGIFLISQGKAPLSLSQKPALFRVSRGESVMQIGYNLEKSNIFSRPLVFYWYTRIFKKDNVLKAGTYRFHAPMTLASLISLFEEGPNASQRITFPEGWTLKQMVTRLREKEFSVKEEDFSLHNSMRASRSFLKDLPKDGTLEGFLFPDTYVFPLDALPEDIKKIFLDNFQKNALLAYEVLGGVSNNSLFEIITMASILERELKTKEDKKIASGLLWRRLIVGMPLQVDATTNYVTGKRAPSLTSDDLAIDSPYNTYTHTGLPPGPISNPGLDSIEAAISPQASDYWFYLSRQDTGETIFSKTLKDHNIAKAKYLR